MALDTSVIQKWILVMILATVLFSVVAELLPEMETAGDLINDTGAPLTGFFESGGIVFLLVLAGLLLLIVYSFMPTKSGGRK